MNSKDWKELRQELENRGFDVELKGRKKHEYIAKHDSFIVDIFRGGISGTGSQLLMYVFDPDTNDIVDEISTSMIFKLLDIIDGWIEYYAN